MTTNAPPPRIRKAVIPVAGRGLTLLPATRAVPKALLPIVDKPLAEFAVEEAAAAGIEQVIFVTSRYACAVDDHFSGWHKPSARVTFASVRQSEPEGLGHALCCAEPLLDGEPFAVLLPDELVLDPRRGIGACIALYERTGHSVIATEPITLERTASCAVVTTAASAGRTRVTDAAERPGPQNARSLTGIVGRQVLTNAIFAALHAIQPKSRPLHLADALQGLIALEPVYAIDVGGQRIDCGTRSGLVEAMLEVASRDPELAPAVMRWRETKIKRNLTAIAGAAPVGRSTGPDSAGKPQEREGRT